MSSSRFIVTRSITSSTASSSSRTVATSVLAEDFAQLVPLPARKFAWDELGLPPLEALPHLVGDGVARHHKQRGGARCDLRPNRSDEAVVDPDARRRPARRSG